MTSTSRRAVVAGIATASAASVTAIAAPVVINPATDPIFAAIERPRGRRGVRSRLRSRKVTRWR